jgi:hypothetical protein
LKRKIPRRIGKKVAFIYPEEEPKCQSIFLGLIELGIMLMEWRLSKARGEEMKRNRHYTEWAATLATAAELTRQGYDVTLTFGNTPRVDLLCSVPGGNQFKVQVKGIAYANALFIQKYFFEDATQPDLFFIIVLVSEAPPFFRFFVMTHGEVKDAWAEWCKRRIEKGYYVSMCDECWDKKNPGRRPVRFGDGKEETCSESDCGSGRKYKSGVILTRNDGQPYKEGCDGLLWSSVEGCSKGSEKGNENRWDKFPLRNG